MYQKRRLKAKFRLSFKIVLYMITLFVMAISSMVFTLGAFGDSPSFMLVGFVGMFGIIWLFIEITDRIEL